MRRWHLDIPEGASRALWGLAGLIVFGTATGWAILSRSVDRIPVEQEAAQAQVERRTVWLAAEVAEARADAKELRKHLKAFEVACHTANQLQTEVLDFDWAHGDHARAAQLVDRVNQWNRTARQSGFACAVVLPGNVAPPDNRLRD